MYPQKTGTVKHCLHKKDTNFLKNHIMSEHVKRGFFFVFANLPQMEFLKELIKISRKIRRKREKKRAF